MFKKSKMYQVPKIQKLTDIRKYLMIIETMELQKLENAICVKTKAEDQVGTVQNLNMMKKYYGEMTDWIQNQQAKNREDELEIAFMNELAEFTQFWEQTMSNFKKVSEEEMKNLIVKNNDLSNEVYYIIIKG